MSPNLLVVSVYHMVAVHVLVDEVAGFQSVGHGDGVGSTLFRSLVDADDLVAIE